jgi:hypothetical protein
MNRKQGTTPPQMPHLPGILRCAKCAQQVRVPIDRGRIRITCPTCGTKWEWSPGEAPSRREAVRPTQSPVAEVTNIRTNAELDAYKQAHPNGWVVGIREYVRILPLNQFRQEPEGKRGTLVCCAPNGAPDSTEALARVWLTHSRGKKAGRYRLYYFAEPPPEAVTALERLGYWVYTVPGTAPTGGRGPLFASGAPGMECIYGRRRPGQEICYIGRTRRYAERDREHSWRFGPTEAVLLEIVESGLAATREREWIQKYDAAGIPLYNETDRLPGALWPAEPRVGTLLPLAEKKRWAGG